MKLWSSRDWLSDALIHALFHGLNHAIVKELLKYICITDVKDE